MRRISKISVCISSMLFCISCNSSSVNDRRAEFVDEKSIEKAFNRAIITSGDTNIRQWPTDQWWHEFHNKDLNSSIDTALEYSPELKKSVAKLSHAEALTQIEGAPLVPFVDTEMNTTSLRVPNHGVFAAFNPKLAGDNATVGALNPFSLRYEIDFWGKNRAALDSSIGEAMAEEAEHEHVKLLLTTAVSRSFIRLYYLKEQMVLIEEMENIKKERLDIAIKRNTYGIENLDVIKQSNIDLENTKKKYESLKSVMLIEKEMLTKLVGGVSYNNDLLFQKSSSSHLDFITIPIHMPIELLAHRPDLAAALHRAEAAAKLIHVAKTEFLPSFDLAALMGLQALTKTNNIGRLAGFLFRPSATNYELVPGLHLPFFEGGRLRGQLGSMRAEYDQAVESYNETLINAMQQTFDGLINYHQSNKILLDQKKILRAENDEVQLSNNRYSNGIVDRREVLDFKYKQLEQKILLKEVESIHLISVVDLIQALGGGYNSGVTNPKPSIDPELTTTGAEKLSPAWVIDDIASTLANKSISLH